MDAAVPFAEASADERWAIVVPHRDRLVRIAVSRTDNAHDAEDCVHEALMRCVQFDDLDAARAGAFLTATTLRLCVDYQRQREQHRRLVGRLSGRPHVEQAAEDRVCDRAMAAWVARHVALLPERQRLVLSASADGMSCAEVAAFYDLPFKAVESALHRARLRLRSLVATDGH